MTQAPSPYSQHNPKLQVAWDSTSLKALMTCPRFYQLAMLEGWRGTSVHLDFGIMFASAVETYKKARLDGRDKTTATMLAIKRAMEDSWIDSGERCELCTEGASCTVCELSGEPPGKPWGGDYENLWHCTGTVKYKNPKGNRAKCPNAHVGVWFPAPAPETCGLCGSPIEVVRQYVPVDRLKNRKTLIRLVAWYCEEQPEHMDEGWHALKFPNGQPAVELSWKIPLDWSNKYGEPYILAGHFDSLMTDGREVFVSDNKTTKNSFGASYWQQFSPNVQVDTYDLAGSLLFPGLNVRGVRIEAAQITQDGARFAQQPFYTTDARREEYLTELRYWLGQAEKFAEDDYWPMNRTNCKLCPFAGICSKDPGKRKMFLQGNFTKQPWNPLAER